MLFLKYLGYSRLKNFFYYTLFFPPLTPSSPGNLAHSPPPFHCPSSPLHYLPRVLSCWWTPFTMESSPSQQLTSCSIMSSVVVVVPSCTVRCHHVNAKSITVLNNSPPAPPYLLCHFASCTPHLFHITADKSAVLE